MTTAPYPRVVQNFISTPQSTTLLANTFEAIDGFSTMITPQFATSMVRIDVTWNGYFAASFDRLVFQIGRGFSIIGMPTSFGSRTAGIAAVGGNVVTPQTLHTVSFSFIDSPNSTSAQQYYIGLLSNVGVVVKTNSSTTDLDNNSYLRTCSSVILTEIFT